MIYLMNLEGEKFIQFIRAETHVYAHTRRRDGGRRREKSTVTR